MTELADDGGAPRFANWAGRNWALVLGLVMVGSIVALALLAEIISPASPTRMRMAQALLPPSGAHWFGTDNLGRDVASRVFYGTRISLFIGIATVLLTGIAGTLLGLVAGYVRTLDGVLMRIMDGFMAFPALMLAVAITATLGPSSINAVVALAAVYIPRTARVVRASALVVSQLDYVESARVLGCSESRILWRHILPNCLGPLIVQLTFVFAYAVLSEAALSFLGMGTPPPTPTLGAVIAEGRDYVREAPWICLFPGLALLICVLGLNLMGDGLRDRFDPRRSAGEP